MSDKTGIPDSVYRRVKQAEHLCHERGARFTKLRRRVLENLLRHNAPVGAYDLLAELRQDGFSDAPPTVYRALDFLRAHGLAHRVNSTNAFVACDHPGEIHAGILLICQDCGRSVEIEPDCLVRAVREQAALHDFEPATQLIEVSGRCQRCRLS